MAGFFVFAPRQAGVLYGVIAYQVGRYLLYVFVPRQAGFFIWRGPVFIKMWQTSAKFAVYLGSFFFLAAEKKGYFVVPRRRREFLLLKLTLFLSCPAARANISVNKNIRG